MKKYIYKIIGLFYLVNIFISNANAYSSKSSVEISRPAGDGILPGSNLSTATDIKTSSIFSKFIPFVIKYAIGLAVALSVIAIIFGGYQYLTAYGDEEKHKNAQKTITWAIIGLILAITAFGIVKIITNLKIV